MTHERLIFNFYILDASLRASIPTRSPANLWKSLTYLESELGSGFGTVIAYTKNVPDRVKQLTRGQEFKKSPTEDANVSAKEIFDQPAVRGKERHSGHTPDFKLIARHPPGSPSRRSCQGSAPSRTEGSRESGSESGGQSRTESRRSRCAQGFCPRSCQVA